jgi:5'-3' exonuclease
VKFHCLIHQYIIITGVEGIGNVHAVHLITKYGMLISHLIFSLYNCNDRCFEDSKKTLAELMSLFFSTLVLCILGQLRF